MKVCFNETIKNATILALNSQIIYEKLNINSNFTPTA